MITLLMLAIGLLLAVLLWRISVSPPREAYGSDADLDARSAARLRHPSTGHVRLVDRPGLYDWNDE